MTIPLSLLILIIVGHYVADWLCQTREMAEAKGHDNRWLLYHVAIYTGVISVIVSWGVDYTHARGWGIWALLNGALHFGTDYVTSRLNARFWLSGRKAAFWNCIGSDQAAHYLTLILTAYWLLT